MNEKKPNQPVKILPPVDPREFEEAEPDEGLFGTDDLIGLDMPVNDEGANA